MHTHTQILVLSCSGQVFGLIHGRGKDEADKVAGMLGTITSGSPSLYEEMGSWREICAHE